VRRFGTVLAMACFVPHSASLATGCGDYKNKTLVSLQFAEAAALLPKIEPKSEFETTAACNARVADAVKKAPSRLLIERRPNRDYLRYDADKGVLVVSTYAFSNENFNWSSALASYKDPAGKGVSGLSGTVGAVVTRKEQIVGEYEATTMMGAKATVSKIVSEITAIYDRQRDCPSVLGCGSLFPDNKEPNPYELHDAAKSVEHKGIVGRIPLPPDTAKGLKATAKLIFVVRPRPPFLISGTHQPYKTTIDNPRNITEKYDVMIGSIECGLVADDAGKVYGAYSTK
jgi:hypothetical protein